MKLFVMLGRVFWMLVGPMILLLLAVSIANAGGWLTVSNVAYLIVLAGIILGRWMEFLAGDARTASGDPAAPSDLRNYALSAIGAGLVCWAVANLYATHW